jgi:hypothetical protein
MEIRENQGRTSQSSRLVPLAADFVVLLKKYKIEFDPFFIGMI